MPREITKHRTVLDAIKRIDLIADLTSRSDDHYSFELDLEVIVYGRNYNGKRVGPYLRLLEFDAGEVIVHQHDWANNFYITVEGELDVYVSGPEGGAVRKVGEIPPGTSFGEMSILAGVPRNATVRVPTNSKARVLEIERPALRLLRKLPKFGQRLDETYRRHGLGITLAEMWRAGGEGQDAENLDRLSKAARLMIYGKQHVLIREGDPIDRLVLIVNGWMRRVSGTGGQSGDGASDQPGWTQHVDFLGAGHWLGLEGVPEDARWGYTATLMGRTEVLEVSLAQVRADVRLRDALRQSLHRLAPGYSEVSEASTEADLMALAAVEKEIMTGVVDGTNLLVMDLDKCVRCGNCSMACHQVHGHSRLVRRGIHIERPLPLSGASGRRVLTPEVCMHCQDPLCLTGCPTGAIGRFENGQIDIDPKTCIGCGDCAAQCPYNAITMIPRKPETPVPRTFARRLLSFLDLRRPAPPPPVSETYNLLAITCNLCQNTPLNPRGAKRPAYSCEENCPTGALARVNPREYFTEAKNRISLVYRDQTHAVGRNVLQRDKLADLLNVFGAAVVAALTLGVVWGFVRYGVDTPLGSTGVTMRLVAALLGFDFLALSFAYALRKKIYRRRAGALRYWMQVHVYAGAAACVLLLLHAGAAPRGTLTSLLTLSLYLTLLTSLFGGACYLVGPRLLTDLEGEPLIVEDLLQRRTELREKLIDIRRRSTPATEALINARVHRRFFTPGFLLRQYARREELSELLKAAREKVAAEAGDSLDPAARSLLLEAVEAAVILRRVDALVYLHRLLKRWLVPHVWAAALTAALMLVHVTDVIVAAAR